MKVDKNGNLFEDDDIVDEVKKEPPPKDYSVPVIVLLIITVLYFIYDGVDKVAVYSVGSFLGYSGSVIILYCIWKLVFKVSGRAWCWALFSRLVIALILLASNSDKPKKPEVQNWSAQVPTVNSVNVAPKSQPSKICNFDFKCQQELISKGYDLGPSGADGIWGQASKDAWNKCVSDGVCINPPSESHGYQSEVPGYPLPPTGHSHGNEVHVNGYTKKNGTYVAPYTRSAPHRR